jgi:hypothetical protein
MMSKKARKEMKKQQENNLSDESDKTGVRKSIFIGKLLKLNQLKTDDCLFLAFFVFLQAHTRVCPLACGQTQVEIARRFMLIK